MGGFLSQMKYIGQGLAQAWPPKPKFSTDQIPDLTGRVVIVTGKQNTLVELVVHYRGLKYRRYVTIGASSGIGKHTVQVSGCQ